MDDLNRNFISVQDKIEDLIYKNANGISKGDRGEFENSIQSINEKTEEIKSIIQNYFTDDKNSVLESLIDNSINKINSNADNILNVNKEAINEKFEEFCNLSNENSQAIKNELQMQCETFLEKLTRLEGAMSLNENYSINDMASDIAKIRVGIEKSDKLANFKEFASRLVELKNINLENAKISRVIGSDILRFDTWLKNTTAKIDLLTSKIDKSEKIKMDDLKARLANEKGQSPSKMEETLLSVYKKYRVQETKMDDISSKIEMLFQRQTEAFDIKEFIDLFYDNMKKQEDLISRMDGLEDKMDLIQTKIDHIISSCIDD